MTGMGSPFTTPRAPLWLRVVGYTAALVVLVASMTAAVWAVGVAIAERAPV